MSRDCLVIRRRLRRAKGKTTWGCAAFRPPIIVVEGLLLEPVLGYLEIGRAEVISCNWVCCTSGVTFNCLASILAKW
jgi:hypothetical protein